MDTAAKEEDDTFAAEDDTLAAEDDAAGAEDDAETADDDAVAALLAVGAVEDDATALAAEVPALAATEDAPVAALLATADAEEGTPLESVPTDGLNDTAEVPLPTVALKELLPMAPLLLEPPPAGPPSSQAAPSHVDVEVGVGQAVPSKHVTNEQQTTVDREGVIVFSVARRGVWRIGPRHPVTVGPTDKRARVPAGPGALTDFRTGDRNPDRPPLQKR